MSNYRIVYPVVPLLGVAFIVLKLVGTITWSWWWVLAPFWMPFAIVVLFGGLTFIVISIADAMPKPRHGKGVGRHRR